MTEVEGNFSTTVLYDDYFLHFSFGTSCIITTILTFIVYTEHMHNQYGNNEGGYGVFFFCALGLIL
jgi:hypothetical protein